MKERKNWAYGVSINGVGTVFYGREYFAREGIVNPLTAAPYTKDEITAIVNGADGKAEGYVFDLPEDADSSFFLCKELIPGYLDDVTGVYQTPQGYYVKDEDVEEFDKEFPFKEKLKLAGQIFG